MLFIMFSKASITVTIAYTRVGYLNYDQTLILIINLGMYLSCMFTDVKPCCETSLPHQLDTFTTYLQSNVLK